VGTFSIGGGWDATDGLHVLEGEDVQAFAGCTVTVRGWPEKGWKPGQPGTARLAVQAFAPGSSPDFLSGRVRVVGKSVFVHVWPEKDVRITDPRLKAALGRCDGVGVILNGRVTRTAGGWRFADAPRDYWVLGGFLRLADTPPKREGKTVSFLMQIAHGGTAPATLPTSAWDSGSPKVEAKPDTPRRSRHFLFGHFDARGRFVATRYTPSAGVAQHTLVEFARSAAFRKLAARAGPT
jgi:hypothetical protein